MKTKTIVRADLVDKITQEFRVSQDQAAGYVVTVLSVIGTALAKGDSVQIPNFGTFRVRGKGKRVGRNPKTLEEYQIDARTSVTFVASNNLKKAINS